MDLVQSKINELIYFGRLNVNDHKYKYFVNSIIQSVVYEWILPNGHSSNSFRCPFDDCEALTSTSKLMEKHLRREHYDEIPYGVFGVMNKFYCYECHTSFEYYEHYRYHKTANYNVFYPFYCHFCEITFKVEDDIVHADHRKQKNTKKELKLMCSKKYYNKKVSYLVFSFY